MAADDAKRAAFTCVAPIVAMLGRLPVAALRDEYQRLFLMPPPRPRDRQDIIKRIAFALQQDALDDLLPTEHADRLARLE